MHIFNKVLGRDKFTSNVMPCPKCHAQKAKFIEPMGFDITRWRCGACGQTWKYVKTSYIPDLGDKKNPSHIFGGPKIVEKLGFPNVGRKARKMIVGQS